VAERRSNCQRTHDRRNRPSTERLEVWAYVALALIYSVVLLVWNFPPDTRSLVSILPLLTYGLSCEVKYFIRVARCNPLPALVTAFGIIGVLGCLVVYSHYLISAELYPAICLRIAAASRGRRKC
jgi:hypothetical protein